MKKYLPSLVLLCIAHFAFAQETDCEDDSNCATGTCQDGTCVANGEDDSTPPEAEVTGEADDSVPPEPDAPVEAADSTPPEPDAPVEAADSTPPAPAPTPAKAAADASKKKVGEECTTLEECASGNCEDSKLRAWSYMDGDHNWRSCGVSEQITDEMIAKNCPQALRPCVGTLLNPTYVGTPCATQHNHAKIFRCADPNPWATHPLTGDFPTWLNEKYEKNFPLRR